jgi:phosphonate transport system substrate-binding protein
MGKLWHPWWTLVALALTLQSPLGCALSWADEHTFVVGQVSNNPKKHYRELKLMADYLASKMTDLGITAGDVVLARDNQLMVEYLSQGKVDLVTDTPFSAVYFADAAGARMILRKWKEGVPDYSCVFITHKDSDISSLAQLRGKKIAFEDPSSTTSYFVPVALLTQAGLGLSLLSSPRASAPADLVGFAFANDELNITTWVHRRLVDVGAYSNRDWNEENNTPLAMRQDLRIVHESRTFPRAIELVRHDLAPHLVARLTDVLLHIHEDPAAAEALAQYHHTTRFDELTDDIRAQLEEVRRIMNTIPPALR